MYEFHGMRRSGNHAILNWIFQNIEHENIREQLWYRSFTSEQLTFINSYYTRNESQIPKEVLRTGIRNKSKYTFISYEDCWLDISIIPRNPKKFIIIRNIENVVASRLASPYDFFVDDSFFKMWESHARSDFFKIHYDKWLIDKEYRNLVSNKLGLKNKDIIDTVTDHGGGSSFIGIKLDNPKHLLTRYQQINIPQDIKEKIVYYGERNPEFYNNV